MLTLFEMRFNCWKWKRELAQIKSDLMFRRLVRPAIKAGFREDQPRDAAGKWTLKTGLKLQSPQDF